MAIDQRVVRQVPVHVGRPSWSAMQLLSLSIAYFFARGQLSVSNHARVDRLDRSTGSTTGAGAAVLERHAIVDPEHHDAAKAAS